MMQRQWRLLWSIFLLLGEAMSFTGTSILDNFGKGAQKAPKSSETALWGAGRKKDVNVPDDDYEEQSSMPATKRNPGRLRPKRPKVITDQMTERRLEAQKRHAEALKDPTLLTNVNFADRNDMHPSTKRALTQIMGLQSMTEVQLQTYAAALDGKSVVARARTGTGKTLAFLLPIVERLLSGDRKIYRQGRNIGALIVAPSRELAIQIADEARVLLQLHGLTAQCIYGGTKLQRDTALMTKEIPAVLVATPGRLLAHIEQTRIRSRRFQDVLSETNIVTLDETDRLLDMGFQKEVKRILSCLPRSDKRQTFLFSATIPLKLRSAMRDIMGSDFVEVDCLTIAEEEQQTNLRVRQSYMLLDSTESYISALVATLSLIMRDTPDFKVVVFFPAAKLVRFFVDIFTVALGIRVIELHSRMSQSARQRASSEFRSKKQRSILFTSDVSARGIDYPRVTHVVQYGYPENDVTYVHRLGRTARAGRSGEGLLILFPFERSRISALKKNNVEEIKPMKSDRIIDAATKENLLAALQRIRSGDLKLTRSAEGAYRAFLACYIAQAADLGLSHEEVVSYANKFARFSGLPGPPSLSEKIASRLGISKVYGVNIEREQ